MRPKQYLCLGSLICLSVAVTMSGTAAHARPPYMAQFSKTYPSLAEAANTTKCFVCHGSSKKERNAYGSAFGQKLGAENVKDEAVIEKAMKEAEEIQSSSEGMTFGQLIATGKLPQ